LSTRRFAVIAAAAATGGFVLGTVLAVIAIQWFIIIPGREELRTALTDFDLQQAQQLRQGKTASVIEVYEHRVDMYVRAWGREPDMHVRPEALLATVAAYRTAYPRRTADTALDDAVRRSLAPRAAARP